MDLNSDNFVWSNGPDVEDILDGTTTEQHIMADYGLFPKGFSSAPPPVGRGNAGMPTTFLPLHGGGINVAHSVNNGIYVSALSQRLGIVGVRGEGSTSGGLIDPELHFSTPHVRTSGDQMRLSSSSAGRMRASVGAGADEEEDNSSVGSLSSTEEAQSGDGSTVLNAKAKNREHARNTRKRKKNYIENLRKTVMTLAEEREQLDRDRRISLSRLAERDHIRKQVLQNFFYYRAAKEIDPVKWGRIVDDQFTMVLPITPYRSFPAHEVEDGQRYVKGIDGLIRDTTSLHVMAQSIAKNSGGKEVRLAYYSGPQDTVMSDEVYMCRWVMRTENAVECGALHECFKQGMLKASFTPQNKLLRIDQSFDVMSFMQQVRRARGSSQFSIVPNTVEIAESEMETSDEARIITRNSSPAVVTKVNAAWEKLCGFTENEVLGQDCKFLQGEKTDRKALKELMESVRSKRSHATVLTNYKKGGREFKNFLRIYPLYKQNKVTHFLGTLIDCEEHVATTSK